MGAELVIAVAGAGDLATCRAVRRRVFVLGQGIPEALEIDGRDADCVHWLARRGGRAVGTARLRVVGGDAKAERVAVLAAERGAGVGRALMEAMELEARARGHGRLLLHAQEDVVPFYERLGYRAEGPRFLEAGIPHRAMGKALAPPARCRG